MSEIMEAQATGSYERIIEELKQIEQVAKGTEKEGIKARWDFGARIVALRVGKKLPVGLLANVMSSCMLSRPEIQMRMKLATKYANEDEIYEAIREYPSWHQMVRDGLYDRKAKAARPAKVKPFALSLDDAIAVFNRLWKTEYNWLPEATPRDLLGALYGESDSVAFDPDLGMHRV